MGVTLFVYNTAGLKEMRRKKHEYSIVSIATLFNKYDSLDILEHIDEDDIENFIFDITSFIEVSHNNKFFFERYMLYLRDNLDSVNLCINESYYDYINEIYPHLFIDETINYDYISLKQDNLDDLLEINKSNPGLELPIPLYSYEKLESLRDTDKENSIITLTSLIPDNDNILYNDAFEQLLQNIKSENVNYIDISSSIKILKSKSELISSFEKIIYKLQYLSNMKFLIQETLKEDAIKLFPIYFYEVFKLEEEQKKVEEIKPGYFEYQHIISIIKEVNNKLLGHKQFKNDFQFNLTKFSILNKLNERRNLSVFICGKSGIEKTEFAKILSKAMYPEGKLIKINFGNYSTEGVLNSLIGSPLGYAGSEEGGELINKIKTSG